MRPASGRPGNQGCSAGRRQNDCTAMIVGQGNQRGGQFCGVRRLVEQRPIAGAGAGRVAAGTRRRRRCDWRRRRRNEGAVIGSQLQRLSFEDPIRRRKMIGAAPRPGFTSFSGDEERTGKTDHIRGRGPFQRQRQGHVHRERRRDIAVRTHDLSRQSARFCGANARGWCACVQTSISVTGSSSRNMPGTSLSSDAPKINPRRPPRAA